MQGFSYVVVAACFIAAICPSNAFMAQGPSSTLGLRSSPSICRAVISRPQIARAAGITMQGRNEESKLFVGGLPWALDSEDLRQAFAEFGAITDANVVYDRETGRSRGFGFVTFDDKESAQKAVTAMNQAEIGGRTVNVNFAQAREPREGGFRGGRGGGGRGGFRQNQE